MEAASKPVPKKKYGSIGKFFKMLWKAPLPFIWIIL